MKSRKETKSTLYLVRGFPGQGKTTFANTAFPNIPKFENDQFFYRNGEYLYDKDLMDDAIEWCRSSVEDCLAMGMDCCVSNTFTKKRFVDSYRLLARMYNADFKVYRMMGDFKNVHNVPKSVLESMKSGFEGYEGEFYVYPNLNQSKDDDCYRPYMLTDLKVGDRIEVERFAHPEVEHKIVVHADGAKEESGWEMEKCMATVTGIKQGTYDYLNVSYVEDKTNSAGICMSGDCRKVVSE